MTLISSGLMNRPVPILFTLLALIVLNGCSSYPGWLPSSGPGKTQVQETADTPNTQNVSGIQVVEINDAVTRKLLASQQQRLFSEVFVTPSQPAEVVGAGDVLEVSIWEAPPAALFGGSATFTDTSRSGPATTRVTAFPEQMVNSDGLIKIPFAGPIRAAGRTPHQIEREIVWRLKDKANQPQALVRVIHNNTADVTVVGEVVSSKRVPLTARGERLLDALAAAGGVRQPVNKMTLQITRNDQVQALPLETIIRDPKQNIVLQPGDVVTSLFQTHSFNVLGATGKNEEVNFEAQGISLAQALARSGGLQDARADAQGVFIFRFESPDALDLSGQAPVLTPEGKVPVIYRVNLKDPATFFVAQNFPVKDKDVLYVSNASAAELQKFLNIIVSVVYPIVNVQSAIR